MPPGKSMIWTFNLVSERAELPVPELVHLLGQAGQRRFPTGLLLIDGPAVVGAERVGKAIDLNLGQPIGHRALDDDRHALQGLFVGNS